MKRGVSNSTSSNNKRQFTDGEDVFYTNADVIIKTVVKIQQLCLEHNIVLKSAIDFSAGNGAFIQQLKLHIGDSLAEVEQYDLLPMAPVVEPKDWFDVPPHRVDFIGFNPPFGFQCKLAKRFLHHAAEFEPHIICCLHLFMRKNIFPRGYRVVLQEQLQSDSFYNPKTLKILYVPGCIVSYLVRDNDHKPAVQLSSQPSLSFIGCSKVKRERPWDEFKQGYAIRRTGVNAGRQVFVWFGKDNGGGVLINQKGEQTTVQSIQQSNCKPLSPQPFATYESTHAPSIAIGQKLWDILHSRLVERQQAIVPTLDVPFISSALVDAHDQPSVDNKD